MLLGLEAELSLKLLHDSCGLRLMDCTGSITYTAGVASGETQDMVIVSGGTEIFGIDALPSTTATFVAKKQ